MKKAESSKTWSMARKMASMRVKIVPIPSGEKGCRLSGWPELATSDEAQIAKWAEAEPDGNYGCVADDRVVILDADNAGLQAQIEMDTGQDFPSTFMVRSAKGYHYYFEQTDKSRALGNRSRGELFDLQSSRKYVVGPESLHPSGVRYSLIKDVPLAPIPDWIVNWLDQRSRTKPTVKIEGTPPPGMMLAKTSSRPLLDDDFDPLDWLDWYTDQEAFEIVGTRAWQGNTVHITDKCIIAGVRHSGSWHTGFIVGDGVFGHRCESPECEGAPIRNVLRKLGELGFAKYPHPIWDDNFDESKLFPVDDVTYEDGELDGACVTDQDAALAAAPVDIQVDYQVVRNKVDDIMRLRSTPTKDDAGTPLREKHRMVCAEVYRHMRASGMLYNCGNVASYLEGQSRELVQVVKGNAKFNRLLMRYGILPADALSDALGQYLGARAVTDAPEKTVYNLSFYDSDEHVLYVNEYAGYFLRITGDQKVSRCRNGDHGVLFSDGAEQRCDPLHADIDTLHAGDFGEDSLISSGRGGVIQKYVLDTIRYDETQMGRDVAHMVLMTSILGLYLYERIQSYPYVFLYGAGAAMKSSLCKAVGRLVQGKSFRVVAAESDPQKLKDLAISLPFLVLDEANNLRKLSDLLKAIGTGAMDSRRELYTTASMRHTPYQARIWMTANTADISNETVSARMLIIDAASRTEAEPYRSEHYLNWSAETRNAVWTELVGRLTTAMYALRVADETGQGDLSVDHRMSGFFVLGRAIAKKEGYEDRFLSAMQGVKRRQEGTSLDGNEIVELMRMVPLAYANTPRRAKDWSDILTGLVDERKRELYSKVCRPKWVSWQFAQNAGTLTKEFGMSTTRHSHDNVTLYEFRRLRGENRWPTDDGPLIEEHDQSEDWGL